MSSADLCLICGIVTTGIIALYFAWTTLSGIENDD